MKAHLPALYRKIFQQAFDWRRCVCVQPKHTQDFSQFYSMARSFQLPFWLQAALKVAAVSLSISIQAENPCWAWKCVMNGRLLH